MRQYAESLLRGETVQFRPHGNSMKGKIASGDLVTVVPVSSIDVKVGDVVLCKVKGRFHLHLVKAIRRQDGAFLIGNNRGHINGWSRQIYGKVLFQG